MQHAALGVEAQQRRQRLPLVAVGAVGRVLHHQHVVLVRELQQPVPPLEGEGRAGRVLEVGDGVDHPDVRVRLEDALQVVGVHPVGVRAHGRVRRLGRREGDQRAEERRVLGHDDAARVDHELGGEVETLLAALDDQDVVGGPRRAVVGQPLRRPARAARAARSRSCTAAPRRARGPAGARRRSPARRPGRARRRGSRRRTRSRDGSAPSRSSSRIADGPHPAHPAGQRGSVIAGSREGQPGVAAVAQRGDVLVDVEVVEERLPAPRSPPAAPPRGSGSPRPRRSRPRSRRPTRRPRRRRRPGPGRPGCTSTSPRVSVTPTEGTARAGHARGLTPVANTGRSIARSVRLSRHSPWITMPASPRRSASVANSSPATARSGSPATSRTSPGPADRSPTMTGTRSPCASTVTARSDQARRRPYGTDLARQHPQRRACVDQRGGVDLRQPFEQLRGRPGVVWHWSTSRAGARRRAALATLRCAVPGYGPGRGSQPGSVQRSYGCRPGRKPNDSTIATASAGAAAQLGQLGG